MPVPRNPQPPLASTERTALSGRRPTVHETWGDDHIENLERRLRGSEREPNNHAYFVSVEELCRVLALSNLELPDATRRRLKAIGAGAAPRAPTGPKSRNPATAMIHDVKVLNYFDRCRAYFDEIKQLGGKAALAEAAQHLGIEDTAAAPAALSYAMTRRRHFSTHSHAAVANIITKIRRQFP